MNTTDTPWTIPSGTEVRTVYGQTGELLIDWFNWECEVVVSVAGRTERYHPAKVFVDGAPLPYRP